MVLLGLVDCTVPELVDCTVLFELVDGTPLLEPVDCKLALKLVG